VAVLQDAAVDHQDADRELQGEMEGRQDVADIHPDAGDIAWARQAPPNRGERRELQNARQYRAQQVRLADCQREQKALGAQWAASVAEGRRRVQQAGRAQRAELQLPVAVLLEELVLQLVAELKREL
jgi:hypothetical protein